MKLSRHRRITRLGINMTPMIDIVFLLIIFFMTVSQITHSLEHPLNLPDIEQGGRSPETISITINLDDEGRLIIAGRQYSLAEALAATQRELERSRQRPARLNILIRGDRDCPGRFVNELVQGLNELGIYQIRLSVQSQAGRQP